ncbi:MAG: hypothetical protein RR288_03055 [Oscillibacter sp.]
MKNDHKQTGKVNYIWVLAGGYLWYLAFRLVQTLWRGEAGSVLLSVLGIAVFVAVGAMLFFREWKAYEYGKQHIDDPETWSDEPPTEEPAGDKPDVLDEKQEEHHGD